MGGILRIEPLMLNNKLAIIRINNLIDSIAGDVSTPGSGSTTLEGTDGVALADGGTVVLHTAVGYANKRVIIKATDGVVRVKTDGQETIDNGTGDLYVPKLHGIELLSDGSNWWITMSYTPQDPEILATLHQIRDLTEVLVRHLEVITDNEDLEDE